MNVTRSVSIPAAIGGVVGVYGETAAWARSFVCVTSSGSFQVQIGQGNPSDCSTGVSFVIPEGADRVTLLNTTSTIVTVTFVLSDAEYVSPAALPPSTGASVLMADAQTQANMANGATASYAGYRTIHGVVYPRKFIDIDLHGGGAGNCATLEDASGNRLGCIENSSSRRFEISADLVLRNTTGGAATLSVYEVF